MEKIDRKFSFVATSIKSGKDYTHKDAIVFLAKDALVPEMLNHYLELCHNAGVDERQIKGVQLLRDRVLKYQRINVQKVKLPDVSEGKEEKKVCKENN